MKFIVNLLADGSVVSADGEYLGAWGTDETDAFYLFTPDGADDHILLHPFFGLLCKQVACWHLGVPYDPDMPMLADRHQDDPGKPSAPL
ncbi:hypothetical protein [Aminobacter sp. MSH1]|uniref:hypothetical protein n=1 Tax=Aminobacter sp. MSH1 TaxID=374606 RepID=UPI00131F43EA|nr:hypothetical protein [Aminobacter sp. MSH1]